MAFENFSNFKDFDDAKLSEEIVNAKKSLFEIRLKKATRQTFKPHVFKHTKRKNSSVDDHRATKERK